MPQASTRPPSFPAKQPVRRGAHGFSLVEVLVSIVVLSLGVLGAVGMQLKALQASKETRFQAVASSMARELAEKMRGNHAVAIQSTPALNPYLIAANLPKSASISTPAQNCYTGACNAPIDIAAWDIAEWQNRLKDALPAPRVVVCLDAAPYAGATPTWACTPSGTNDIVVVKLAWTREDSQGALVTAASKTATPLLVVALTAGSSQ